MKSPATLTKPWKLVALDFIVKLPLSMDLVTQVKYNSILVIMDKLTKYTYIILYKESSTVEQIAFIFIR